MLYVIIVRFLGKEGGGPGGEKLPTSDSQLMKTSSLGSVGGLQRGTGGSKAEVLITEERRRGYKVKSFITINKLIR